MNESFKTRSYRFPVSPMKLLSPSIHIKSHQTDPLGSMFLTSLFCISFIPQTFMAPGIWQAQSGMGCS